jgi:stearoyl-CoA desaturase (delta-9 desaturase)
VFCTTIYLHRTLTHRAMELHPAVALMMHLHLVVFAGLVPREWVAVHRKHHQFSDMEGDPHSPYLVGLWKVLLGNYFYYRKEAAVPATLRKYTPDYKPDLIDAIPRSEWAILVGLGLFMLMFGPLWGLAAMASHSVLYVLLSAMINGLCHHSGYRNFDNTATNLQWVAFLTGGEGLHNNHHEYPTSAKFSLRGREIDPAWPVIRVLESLRLAAVKRLPAAKAA